jgi:hypothetical protein
MARRTRHCLLTPTSAEKLARQAIFLYRLPRVLTSAIFANVLLASSAPLTTARNPAACGAIMERGRALATWRAQCARKARTRSSQARTVMVDAAHASRVQRGALERARACAPPTLTTRPKFVRGAPTACTATLMAQKSVRNVRQARMEYSMEQVPRKQAVHPVPRDGIPAQRV